MALTKREFELLSGLRLAANCYVPASEQVAVRSLCERGFAYRWQTANGFDAWRITERGLAELIVEQERLHAQHHAPSISEAV